MKKLYFTILLLIFTFSVSTPQEKPKIKVTQLGKNLYEISMMSCNVLASVGMDGVLLVDANYKEAGKYMKEEIEKLGGQNIFYIINTHWHFDHVGGNEVLASDKTSIIAHKKTKELMSKDQFLLGDTVKASPNNALPTITIDKTYNLDFNGESIEITPLTGGHTGTDIVVYFKNSNVLHVGDIIFSDMFSFIDCDHGGSVYSVAKNVQKIIDTYPDDVKIVPGHGRIYTKEDLKEYRDMVIATTKIVKDEKDNGKSLEEIIKEDALKDWKDWGVAFKCNDWIEYIYNSK